MTRVLLLLGLLLLSCTAALAQEQVALDEKQAQLAALDFLELLDRGDFAGGWEGAAELFRRKVTKEDWVQETGHLRPAFGALQQRRLKYGKPVEASAESGGQPLYFTIFSSSFSEKTAAEMVTLTRDNDSRWRVVGYSIQ